MKNIKGITLISLVITIIILLILAGISIQAITSDNGLFNRAKQAKEETLIQEGKEKIELSITDLMIEKTENGEELTKEDLNQISSDEITVKSTESFPVEVIYKNYKYNVDENFKVTYISEVDEIEVTYTTDPEGYTTKSEINVLVTVTNAKGIKSIQKPGEKDKILTNGLTKMAFEFKATKNGNYEFLVITQDGKEVTKTITIKNIIPTLNKPTIKTNKVGAYPTFTSEGVTVGKNIIEINYDNDEIIKNYFSEDGGETWKIYEGAIETDSYTIKAKSVIELEDGEKFESEVMTHNVVEFNWPSWAPLCVETIGPGAYSGVDGDYHVIRNMRNDNSR